MQPTNRPPEDAAFRLRNGRFVNGSEALTFLMIAKNLQHYLTTNSYVFYEMAN